jgi:hypothetical protein
MSAELLQIVLDGRLAILQSELATVARHHGAGRSHLRPGRSSAMPSKQRIQASRPPARAAA